MTNREALNAYEKKLQELKMIRTYFLRELNTFHRFEEIRKSGPFNACENAHDAIDYACMKLDDAADAIESLNELVRDIILEEA